MVKDDMIMKTGIVHILDSAMGMPVLSDREMEMGSELSEFLKSHIERFTESDEVKICRFSDGSKMMELVRGCTPENFVPVSQEMAKILFSIMNANIEIPPGDLAVVIFGCGGTDYMGILKLNYRTSYTHMTSRQEDGKNGNSIILQKALLPGQGQRLAEACVISLMDGTIFLTEKKYPVNGEKRLYFSELYLECHAPLSQKTRMDIVTKAVDQVNRKYYGEEDAERKMEVKSAIYQELEETGSLKVENVMEKVFPDSPEMQEELTRKLEKYSLADAVVEPKSEKTVKKFQKQHLTTDTGIEITIPMEEYQNPERVEFLTNADGTVSVLIKNIGRLISK